MNLFFIYIIFHASKFHNNTTDVTFLWSPFTEEKSATFSICAKREKSRNRYAGRRQIVLGQNVSEKRPFYSKNINYNSLKKVDESVLTF